MIYSQELVWAVRDGGLAMQRSPLPLALANPGCSWRRTALDALDRQGLAYRIAYSCEQCAGQEAAMTADLAIAPFPAAWSSRRYAGSAQNKACPPLASTTSS